MKGFLPTQPCRCRSRSGSQYLLSTLAAQSVVILALDSVDHARALLLSAQSAAVPIAGSPSWWRCLAATPRECRMVLNGRVNGMTIDVSKPELPPEVAPVAPPASITVKNVELGGLLGGVDVRDWASRALRTTGKPRYCRDCMPGCEADQFLWPPGDFTFAQLRASATSARLRSGIRIEEIVRTDMNEMIAGELVLTEPLTASRVQVYERMNNVGVAGDLSMDLLLNAGLAGHQQVTTDNGHPFLSARVLDASPSCTLQIGGTVKVVGSVTATDIENPHSGASVLTVVERGIPLDELLPPTVVVEDLEVTNVDVTFVNNIQCRSGLVARGPVDVEARRDKEL